MIKSPKRRLRYIPAIVEREEIVYKFIVNYALKNGLMPTNKEISIGVHLAYNTIVEYLKRMDKQGRIKYKGSAQIALAEYHYWHVNSLYELRLKLNEILGEKNDGFERTEN